MKMRELEARTGVNRETIRVLLREGLLPEPNRPARNVADYGEEHVRAILAVRRLQLDSRMTLPQIKAAMTGQGADTQIGAAAFSQLEELVSARVNIGQGNLAVDALLDQNPKALVDARALAKLGIIQLIGDRDNPQISVTDAGLLNIWCRMREAGFDEDHGFPPDILAYYVEGAEYIAANEAKIFLEQVEGRIGQNQAAAMLELAIPFMLDFFGILRQKAFLRMIGEKTRKGATISVPEFPRRRARVKAAQRKASASGAS